MFVFRPTRMLCTSPRTTVPNHTEEPSSIVTSPMMVALCATKADRAMPGVQQRCGKFIAGSGVRHCKQDLCGRGGCVEKLPMFAGCDATTVEGPEDRSLHIAVTDCGDLHLALEHHIELLHGRSSGCRPA